MHAHTIPWLSNLASASGVDLVLLVLIIVICTWAAGYLIDGLMREFGFGPVLDGIIALCGLWLGLYFRYRFIDGPPSLDYALTGFFAVAAPVTLLFGIGVLRSRVY